MPADERDEAIAFVLARIQKATETDDWLELKPDEARMLEAKVAALTEWRDATRPLIAALAIYGEGANLTALVAKARTLVRPIEDEDPT